MKIVVAIGGSILLKEYDCKKFQEYSAILKDLATEHELFVVVGGGKPAREYISVVRDLGAGEAQCDDIGIEVTRINAKLMLSALGDAAYQRVPHNFQEALEFSATGKSSSWAEPNLHTVPMRFQQYWPNTFKPTNSLT